MDLNLLAVFEAVTRTRSYSAAAKELGIPKSSASRAVARLEEEVGVQLLFRTTRQVSPSAAGTALYDRLAPLLASMKGALVEIPEREELPSGLLRVTAPIDLGVVFLADVVTRYTARYPAASVELHLTGRVVDLVGEGFDVALRAAPRLTDSTLVARRIAPLVLQLFASPVYLARRGTPRSEADLPGHDQVAFRSGPDRLQVKSRTPRVGAARIVCDDFFFAREAARAGAGLTWLPQLLAADDVSQGVLVRVLPRLERQAGHLYLVTPAGHHVARKVSAFRDLVLELTLARLAVPFFLQSRQNPPRG